MQLDEIDLNILKHLQGHARMSNVQLAEAVGLSPAPCLRRVRALEEAGVIRNYATLLDPNALDLKVTVFVRVTLDLQVEGRLEIFEHAVMQRPEVLECYLMTGDADFLLRVVASDVSAYEHFLRDFLTRVESVAGINSAFALKEVKCLTALPLPRIKESQSGTKASPSPSIGKPDRNSPRALRRAGKQTPSHKGRPI